MADNKQTGEKVTDADLSKSIEELKALLDTDSAEEEVEKAVIGTGGGLQAKTPSDGDINVEIVDEDEEEGDIEDESRNTEIDETEPTDVSAGAPMKKSEAEDEDIELTEDEEEFAKALAAAFSEQEPLVESARNDEFAKSLVVSTIEGLSLVNEELTKSLSDMEERSNAKISQLVKALESITKAVTDIKKEVNAVGNAPVRTTAKSAKYIAKSFGDENTQAVTLTKSQIADALVRRVQDGKLDASVVARFESAGQLDPALLAEIQNGSVR